MNIFIPRSSKSVADVHVCVCSADSTEQFLSEISTIHGQIFASQKPQTEVLFHDSFENCISPAWNRVARFSWRLNYWRGAENRKLIS